MIIDVLPYIPPKWPDNNLILVWFIFGRIISTHGFIINLIKPLSDSTKVFVEGE